MVFEVSCLKSCQTQSTGKQEVNRCWPVDLWIYLPPPVEIRESPEHYICNHETKTFACRRAAFVNYSHGPDPGFYRRQPRRLYSTGDERVAGPGTGARYCQGRESRGHEGLWREGHPDKGAGGREYAVHDRQQHQIVYRDGPGPA